MKKFTQFIAGAICPSCLEQDSIAIHKDDDEIFCAKCGYKEFRPGSKKDSKKEAIRLRNDKSSGEKLNANPSPAIEKNSGKPILIK